MYAKNIHLGVHSLSSLSVQTQLRRVFVQASYCQCIVATSARGNGDDFSQGSTTFLLLLNRTVSNIFKKPLSRVGCHFIQALAIQRAEMCLVCSFFLCSSVTQVKPQRFFFYLACIISWQQLFHKQYQRYVISSAVEIEKKNLL